jgi:hypothetical protein
MIRITFYNNKSDGEIIGFKSEGHAGYDDSGKDIVCAATSALVINTINSVEQLTDAEFKCTSDEENAVIMYLITANQSNESSVLLRALELGLSEIALDNPDYISITFEEV